MHVGQADDRRGVGVGGELAVEGVSGEVTGDFARGAGAAVNAGEGAEVGNLVAVCQSLAVVGADGVDGGNAQLVQGGQFVSLENAVLVEVTPDFEVAKPGIARVNLAVVVAVQVRKGIKAVKGQLAVALDGGVAKQFAPVVDHAVAVLVQHQEAVVGLDPAGAGLDPAAGLVEQDASRRADRFQAAPSRSNVNGSRRTGWTYLAAALNEVLVRGLMSSP